MNAFLASFERECRIAWRQKMDVLNPLIFMAIIISLAPLALEPSPRLLAEVAAGFAWLALLLGAQLTGSALFADDWRTGWLKQIFLSPSPATVLVLARLAAWWLLGFLPLVLLSPLAAMMLGLPSASAMALLLALLLASPALLIFTALGAALTLGIGRAAALAPLLVLPLLVPLLIFGAGIVRLHADGLPVDGQYWLLAALSMLSITLGPLAVTAALRLQLVD
jgi:heme exporter protein B